MSDHLVITIPKTVPWDAWLEETRDAAQSGGRLLYRVPEWAESSLRHRIENADGELKVFVVHDGAVRGYHVGAALERSPGFTCATTGRRWPAGLYLVRTGSFYPLADPPPYRGFRGVRRCRDFSVPASPGGLRRAGARR